MPALLHELLVDLFRQPGDLVRELLPPGLAQLVAHDSPRHVSADLSQLAPAEYHADHVIVFYATDGSARLAVVIEVQGRRDERKRLTWPVYAAVTRARYECPTMLLVIALEPSVARWAQRSLESELRDPRYAVISRDEVVKLPERSSASVGLTVLRALADRRRETFVAALGAISNLPQDQAMVYLDAILSLLPVELRRHLEDTMPAPLFRTPMLREAAEHWWRQGLTEGKRKGLTEGKRKGLTEGKRKGLAEGKRKGLAEGLAEGKRKGLAEAAIELVRARLGTISSRDAARLRKLDSTTLSSLIASVGVAASPEQVRRVLARKAT